jgi:hypothetical protein
MRTRVVVSLALALLAGGYAEWGRAAALSDFGVVTTAARAWLAGRDPYGIPAEIGTPYGLFYPFPAVLAAVPFALTPWADGLFAALSLGLWAWAIHGRHPYAWWALPSWAGFFLVRYVQWEALLTAAALLRWPGALLLAKPSVGAALFVAFPSRAAAAGGAVLGLVSLAVLPGWPGAWLDALSTGHHLIAPVQYWGGPLILLALLEWRRPEARLLGAMACVPQSPAFYALFPLFLIPKSHGQGFALWLALMATLVLAFAITGGGARTNNEMYGVFGPLFTLCVYLPCTWMVIGPRVKAWLAVRAPRVAAQLP